MSKQNEANKFAFVTGTSSGLGKAAAIELLSRGWEVYGAARRDTEINNSHYSHFNVDLGDINLFVNLLTEKLTENLNDDSLKRVALLNNAAGVGETVRVEALNPFQLQKLFTINVIAPVWLMGLFYKNCKPEFKLRIINISSGAAYKVYPGLADYGATKAALKLFGITFVEEHSDNKNLAVLSYEPGTVDTEMQATVRLQPEDKFPSVNIFKSLADEKKLVKPEIVANEIADFFEADDRAGFTEARFGRKY